MDAVEYHIAGATCGGFSIAISGQMTPLGVVDAASWHEEEGEKGRL
jgi:hypothetical protein